MRKVKVEDAVGMTLCHDVTAMYDGFKGPAFLRGHVICPEDVGKLLDYGKKTVFVWEKQEGEVHEEDCAIRFSQMAQVENAHYIGPSEGKVLLIADQCGMFRVDTQLLKQLNAIQDITISTLPDHYKVQKGARLASMRIVPLVTKEINIIEAEKLCHRKQLLKLLPFIEKKAGVIITGSEIYSGRIKDKFEPVVREKLSAYPGTILGVEICDDDLNMIVKAAQTFLDKGADFLIFTGGMSVDPDDLTPASIRRLGAKIVSHGVPSQPGNMTLVAYLNKIPILGVPGAAISLKTTIFDVLLPQIYTGEMLSKTDLEQLGEGGLCQQCKVCHFPNCTFGRY